MSNHLVERSIIAAVPAFAAFIIGCGEGSPAVPSFPGFPAPVVTAVSPAEGSTSGGTPIKIAGTGFLPGAKVTLGDTVVRATMDARDPPGTIIYAESAAHSVASVDVVVTNEDRQTTTLPAGYTYAAPDSFDFNGQWAGFGLDGSDLYIVFRIENDRLLSVTCESYETLTFSIPPTVSNGEFSFSAGDGVAVSGRIVSHTDATGAIRLGPCTAPVWRAKRE